MTAPNDQVEELVVIEPDDLDEVRRIAEENGVKALEVEAFGIEPVTTITLLLVGSSLALGAVLYVLDKRKGGQVMDLRKGAPKMLYRSKDLVYGLIAIVATDGKVTVDVKEPKGMFGEVVDALTGMIADLGKGGIEEIGKAVKSAIGDAAEVQAVPAPSAW